jgi:glycosyltransferase involved in cell wall biosynthesis
MSRAAPSVTPRLLFVTYTFPPALTAGSVRTWNIAKYLARSGWVVTVLTPHPSLWRHVEAPEVMDANLERESIRRLATAHHWPWLAGSSVKRSSTTVSWLVGGIGRRLLEYVARDGAIGWTRAAQAACSGLPRGEFDLVLASGPSFSAFGLAKRLAQKFGCPYVLDYRDLWSQNLHHPARFAFYSEASVLAGSSAVTTVSPSWSVMLDRCFGLGGKLHVISNGYDREQLAGVVPHKFDDFAIVYTGTFWPPKRVCSPLMAALSRLRQEHADLPRWTFHYYGKHERHVLEQARQFGVERHVIVHGQVSRGEALAAVKGAGAAVVITSVVADPTPSDNGMVTGKIFEAIGLGTPTVLIAPPGSDANAVGQTSGLARGFVPHDADGIASYLRELMDGTTCQPRDPTVFAWDNIVKRLDGVLRGVI